MSEESFYDERTGEEMEAISKMIKIATGEGLLVEVIWSFAIELDPLNRDKAIRIACYDALQEWIK